MNDPSCGTVALYVLVFKVPVFQAAKIRDITALINQRIYKDWHN
jgi:hypothetical protein